MTRNPALFEESAPFLASTRNLTKMTAPNETSPLVPSPASTSPSLTSFYTGNDDSKGCGNGEGRANGASSPLSFSSWCDSADEAGSDEFVGEPGAGGGAPAKWTTKWIPTQVTSFIAQHTGKRNIQSRGNEEPKGPAANASPLFCLSSRSLFRFIVAHGSRPHSLLCYSFTTTFIDLAVSISKK